MVDTGEAAVLPVAAANNDSEALGKCPVLEQFEGKLMAGKASTGTGVMRWDGGSNEVASRTATASSGVTVEEARVEVAEVSISVFY